MAQVNLRLITLVSQTAAGTTSAIDLDYRNYPSEQARSFICTKSAGDVIFVEVAFDATNGPWARVAEVSSAATSAAFVVAGSWAWIRAEKTGTAGVAILQGMV